MCQYPALMWGVAVFEQIDSLPGSETRNTVGDGDIQADRHHRRLDMGRHVIGAFIGVAQIGHGRVGTRRNQPVKKRLQIALHLRLELLDRELATNPFLRFDDPNVAAGRDPVATFTAIRQAKDNF